MSFRHIAIATVLLAVIPVTLPAQPPAESGPAAAASKSPPAGALQVCSTTARIFSYTRAGVREETFIEPGYYCQIELAPDDKHMVVERRNEGSGTPVASTPYDMWLADFGSRTFTRWTVNPDYARDPVWAPDSKRIGYRVHPGLPRRCRLQVSTVGSNSEDALSENSYTAFPDDWTPDGRFLLYHTDDPDTVVLQPVSPNRQPTVILDEPGGRNGMRVSPDGKWIAYGSNESGDWEIYVAAFPSFEDKHRVTQGGAVQVRWRGDSKEYYYLDSRGRMMAQRFDPSSGKESGAATALFQTSLVPVYQIYLYAVNRDGTEFFLVEAEPGNATGN